MQSVKGVFQRAKEEPVALQTIILGIVYWASEFGFELSAEREAVILGMVAAFLTLWTRQKVTPMSKLEGLVTFEGSKFVLDKPPKDTAVDDSALAQDSEAGTFPGRLKWKNISG